jgi:hypothetical protein
MFDEDDLRKIQEKMREVYPDSELQGADLALHDRKSNNHRSAVISQD